MSRDIVSSFSDIVCAGKLTKPALHRGYTAPLPRPLIPLLPPSESMRYGGTLQTLPSGPSDNPPTKPHRRNIGGLDIAQPLRNNENKSIIHGLLSLFTFCSSSTSVLLLFFLFRFPRTFASVHWPLEDSGQKKRMGGSANILPPT